jgi:hypothetical protein
MYEAVKRSAGARRGVAILVPLDLVTRASLTEIEDRLLQSFNSSGTWLRRSSDEDDDCIMRAVKALIAIGAGLVSSATALQNIAVLTHRKVISDIGVVLLLVCEVRVSDVRPMTNAPRVVHRWNFITLVVNLHALGLLGLNPSRRCRPAHIAATDELHQKPPCS